MAKREQGGRRGYYSELRYDIDVVATGRYGALIVHVRYSFGNGLWHDTPLWRPFTTHFDSSDAAALVLLDGAGGRAAPQGRSGHVDSTFHVPLALAPDVVERLIGTGHAFVAADDGKTDPKAPAIAWDDGDPYELALEAKMVDGGQLTIAPFLERGRRAGRAVVGAHDPRRRGGALARAGGVFRRSRPVPLDHGDVRA